MGYRHYLYKISKKVVKDLQGKTYDELWEKYTPESEKEYQKNLVHESKYLSIHSIPMECVFEFGKLYWEDTDDRIYATGKPLFKDKAVQDMFEDYVPYVVPKEALKVAIEIYEQKIIASYEDLFVENKKLCDPFFNVPVKEVEISVQEKCFNHCREMLAAWKRKTVLDMNEEREDICQSWYYEHNIFDLVRLYKSIDFKKYDLLFFGF